MYNKIGISIGHIGKPHAPLDTGAVKTIGGIKFLESELALSYGTSIYNHIRARNKEVYMFSMGSYRSRNNVADLLGLDLMLHCHVNAGGGNYSLCGHSDIASTKTKETAKKIVNNFSSYLHMTTKRNSVVQLSEGNRGYRILEPFKGSSIILEPFFIDGDGFAAELDRGCHKDVLVSINNKITAAVCNAIL